MVQIVVEHVEMSGIASPLIAYSQPTRANLLFTYAEQCTEYETHH